MHIQFELEKKNYLLIKLSYYGKSFKIEKFKTHAIIEYKTIPEGYNISTNDSSINKLLLNGKVVGTISDIYENKVKGFKRRNKAQRLMNIIDLSGIDQTLPLLLIELKNK